MSQAMNHESAMESGPARSGTRVIGLEATFERLKARTRSTPPTTHAERIASLDRLASTIKRRQGDIAEAVRADFGNRSPTETRLAEVLMLVDGIKYIKKHLKGWISRVAARLDDVPPCARHGHSAAGSTCRARLRSDGACARVGEIGAFPVLVKPSEYTPRSSELLVDILAEAFDPDTVGVVLGGPEVGEAFSRLAFDHLVYTGSTHVGRLVMRAAADNLVPVTLELGGKSPTIVHGLPAREAAGLSPGASGRTRGRPPSPDYVLVPSKVGLFRGSRGVAAATTRPERQPGLYGHRGARHYERISRLVSERCRRGARSKSTRRTSARAGTKRRSPHSAHQRERRHARDARRDLRPLLPLVPIERSRMPSTTSSRVASTRALLLRQDRRRVERSASGRYRERLRAQRCCTSASTTCPSGASDRAAWAPTTAAKASGPSVQERRPLPGEWATAFSRPRTAQNGKAARLPFPLRTGRGESLDMALSPSKTPRRRTSSSLFRGRSAGYHGHATASWRK